MKAACTLAATLLTMTSALAAPDTPIAGHLRATREHSFSVPLPLEPAFTFFEPIGEKRWAEGWHPVFASAEDARLHDGSVFTVDRPHGASVITSVWTITRYEPPRLIEYRNVLPGVRATRIEVRCATDSGQSTKVTVRYVYAGLSIEGDAAIAEVTPAAFAQSIEGWGAAITAYLRRGTPASP